MHIITKKDTDQADRSDRDNLAICPECGQKLFEVESLHTKGLFRHLCRRCRTYIRVAVIEDEENKD